MTTRQEATSVAAPGESLEALPGAIPPTLRRYLASLSTECRRQLLDALEEAALSGALLLDDGSQGAVADALAEMERGDRAVEYPALWRGVCFPAEHALTDAWEGASRWDIPRAALGALYTFTRVRMPEWAILSEGFRTAGSGRARYLVMCAAMSMAGSFLEQEAADADLQDALRRRAGLNAADAIRVVRLFASLVTVGPGFLDSVGEAFGLPVEELTCLPLLPAEMRRPIPFDAAAVRQVAGRYVQLPAAVENQNQLVATQTALLLRNPSEILNLIPARLRQNEDLLLASGFVGIVEYVAARLERHARELRFHLRQWDRCALDDVEFLTHAAAACDLAEQYDRESRALARLVRLGTRSVLGARVRDAERDVIDALIHQALPICWIGVQATSIYALTPLERPRPPAPPHRLANEAQLFRFIATATLLIERSNNRLALDNLRSAVSGFVNTLMVSLKQSWFLDYRADRADAIAMAGHFLCVLGALERSNDIRDLTARLARQRIAPADAMPCKGRCRKACGAWLGSRAG